MAEEEGAEVAHRGGATFLPAHARAFESLRDEAFATGFDGAGAYLPAVGEITRVVHPVLVVAEVLSLFPIGFTSPTPPAVNVEFFPGDQQRGAAFVFQLMTPLRGERRSGCGIIRMTGSGERGHVLARVKEIEHRRRLGKRFAEKILESVAGIADGELLLRCIPIDVSPLSPQLHSKWIEII